MPMIWRVESAGLKRWNASDPRPLYGWEFLFFCNGRATDMSIEAIMMSRFRQFADSWNDDDVIDDSGLTGADLKLIADTIEQVEFVPRINLD
ncbi:hypothetical protein [Sphingobium xenophagum]|nr:hypothetical protein [Sphingobium xenophagum]